MLSTIPSQLQSQAQGSPKNSSIPTPRFNEQSLQRFQQIHLNPRIPDRCHSEFHQLWVIDLGHNPCFQTQPNRRCLTRHWLWSIPSSSLRQKTSLQEHAIPTRSSIKGL